MAASLWLLLLAADAALAALGAALLGAKLHGPHWMGPALLGALFVLIPWILVSTSVLLAAGSRALSSPVLRAMLTEPAQFALAIARVILEPWRASPDTPAAHGAQARPLLLLHGIVCNRGIWRGWLRELRAAGFAPVRALTLEPLFVDIETHAARVARELDALQREARGARVAVLTHSMGGLIARAALPLVAPMTIRRIVTLACPHHGTRLARYYPSAATRQMRPDSAWLAALNAAQEQRWPVPVSSLYSLEDSLIVPASSALLIGAECCPVRGVGHLGLLGSRATRRWALAALAAG
jgi:hypothetical protein